MTFSHLPNELEEPTCPICMIDTEHIVKHDFGDYRVVKCARCGLIFLSPRLTEKAILNLYSNQDYYVSEIAGQGYDEYLDVRHNWLNTFNKRLTQIARYQDAGKVLDIGCGPGFFLEAAQTKGYDVFGIDPSEYIVKVAREKFGEKIRQGVIESADYPQESFDLVTAFDTFEHVYHPLEWLEASQRILKKGGLLAITTPNPESMLSKISGRKWVSYKLPEHVYYWAPATIRQILKNGWEILEINRAGQFASLGFLLRRLFRLPTIPTGFAQSVLKLLGKINIYSDNGSMTVIAKKV
jgi:2-polyprenyl-3-methyl-5-hydroxy-6-metoxy-1,4-benzoquinol methylase